MSKSINIDAAQKKTELLLQQCEGILCAEAADDVRHYIEHGEPEMAFEGLFIELMRIGRVPESVDKKSCVKLGEYLNLDVETVLDDDFWIKFTEFLE